MANPFEATDALYIVLVNKEGQHSLWPSLISVPDGWVVACEAQSRQDCIDFIESNWRDMRPNSLISKMSAPNNT